MEKTEIDIYSIKGDEKDYFIFMQNTREGLLFPLDANLAEQENIINRFGEFCMELSKENLYRLKFHEEERFPIKTKKELAKIIGKMNHNIKEGVFKDFEFIDSFVVGKGEQYSNENVEICNKILQLDTEEGHRFYLEDKDLDVFILKPDYPEGTCEREGVKPGDNYFGLIDLNIAEGGRLEVLATLGHEGDLKEEDKQRVKGLAKKIRELIVNPRGDYAKSIVCEPVFGDYGEVYFNNIDKNI